MWIMCVSIFPTGEVMEDDSFLFLIAMVHVARLPAGDRKGADTNIL